MLACVREMPVARDITRAADRAPETLTAPRRRLLFLLPMLIFLALAALFAARLVSGDPSRIPSALIGRPVPDTTLPGVEGLKRGGEPVPGWSSAEMKAPGQVTVLNVWASWCAPCQEEHPVLMNLAAKEPGIRVIGLNYKDNPENARRFLGALGQPFAAVGIDPNGRTAIDWGVYGVPETFVVGPDGIIRYKHIGPLTPAAMPAFMAKVREAAR
jgi:cytochrome c biogenesis protein CcmG/thiol:disulfide interchange protein DsbE